MRNLTILLMLLLSISNCKKNCDEDDTCEGPDCALDNGEFCPYNFENIDNNCVCPEGSFLLNDSTCYNNSQSNIDWMTFYDEFSCGCIDGSLILNFTDMDNSLFSGNWLITKTNGDTQSYFLVMSNNSTPSSFEGSFYPYSCDWRPLMIHGELSNDTLAYYLYYTNPYESCGLNKIYALE